MNENINTEFQRNYQRIEEFVETCGFAASDLNKFLLKQMCINMVSAAIHEIGNSINASTNSIKL